MKGAAVFTKGAVSFFVYCPHGRTVALSQIQGKALFYLGGVLVPKLNKDGCLALLQERQAQHLAQGKAGYVCRGEFTVEEVVAIKAYFGPWPRALEAAGIKAPSQVCQKDLNRQRRIRAKRNRRLEAKKGKE